MTISAPPRMPIGKQAILATGKTPRQFSRAALKDDDPS